ncbi:MAG: hypothetical protein JWN67_4424 [Actinomycetia bacterium]|nr:hypothetical protein [Actinomycetes bacterium]
MSEHRLQRIDFQRPSRYCAVCTCEWRSEPVLAAGLAGSLWDRHGKTAPTGAPTDAPILDVDLAVGEAARALYALIPILKDAARAGHPLAAVESFDRMELLVSVLGEREQRLARAVRLGDDRLIGESTSRQRATVIVGLVELGERAREHLSRGLPTAPDRLHVGS